MTLRNGFLIHAIFTNKKDITDCKSLDILINRKLEVASIAFISRNSHFDIGFLVWDYDTAVKAEFVPRLSNHSATNLWKSVYKEC